MLTIYWVIKQKRNAEEGNERAASYVIFPNYIPILILSSVADVIFGCVSVFVDFSGEKESRA